MNLLVDYVDLTRRFEAHDIDNTTFHHAEHIQVAFGLLKKYDFIDAVTAYAKGIRALARKAGAPDKFNLTITYAFLSLIAERMAERDYSNPETFAEENPDLMSKNALTKWYASDRLYSDTARSIFLMPLHQKGNSAKVG